MDSQTFAVVMLILACAQQSLAFCVVDSFTVKQDFDPKRVRKRYALQKKDPEGLFLQDNISAKYRFGDDGAMVAVSRGRVTLFGFWVVFTNMGAQYSVPDANSPNTMFMKYQGLARYLSSSGDNYWVIDTDYEHYTIMYACRLLKDDGTCDDGYALVFSRNPRGLPPAIQRVLQPVLQSGTCSVTSGASR
uniref:Lipocalin/cytosolic fatty-acid binding domain-containing protein n=1 Tax=Mola mola TaxID=94237 RepID=A0A3Q4B778_MOLML